MSKYLILPLLLFIGCSNNYDPKFQYKERVLYKDDFYGNMCCSVTNKVDIKYGLKCDDHPHYIWVKISPDIPVTRNKSCTKGCKK